MCTAVLLLVGFETIHRLSGSAIPIQNHSLRTRAGRCVGSGASRDLGADFPEALRLGARLGLGANRATRPCCSAPQLCALIEDSLIESCTCHPRTQAHVTVTVHTLCYKNTRQNRDSPSPVTPVHGMCLWCCFVYVAHDNNMLVSYMGATMQSVTTPKCTGNMHACSQHLNLRMQAAVLPECSY